MEGFSGFTQMDGKTFARILPLDGEPELMSLLDVKTRHQKCGDAAEVLEEWSIP